MPESMPVMRRTAAPSRQPHRVPVPLERDRIRELPDEDAVLDVAEPEHEPAAGVRDEAGPVEARVVERMRGLEVPRPEQRLPRGDPEPAAGPLRRPDLVEAVGPAAEH